MLLLWTGMLAEISIDKIVRWETACRTTLISYIHRDTADAPELDLHPRYTNRYYYILYKCMKYL